MGAMEDFNYKSTDELHNLRNEIDQILETRKERRKEITEELVLFLNKLSNKGYKEVAINCYHPNIEESREWPFGYEGNAFVQSEIEENGFPAIWEVCHEMKDLGYSGYEGSGNEGQHQIPFRLPAGYYEFINGRWIEKEKK